MFQLAAFLFALAALVAAALGHIDKAGNGTGYFYAVPLAAVAIYLFLKGGKAQ